MSRSNVLRPRNAKQIGKRQSKKGCKRKWRLIRRSIGRLVQQNMQQPNRYAVLIHVIQALTRPI